jgi:hypothetical protein
VLRLLLAAVFAVSGVGKLLNADGAVQLLDIVVDHVGWGRGEISNSTLAVVVHIVSAAEIALAALLTFASARWLSFVLVVTLVLLGVFSALLAALLWGGVQLASCGCSGAFDVLWGGGMRVEMALLRNLVLVALALVAWMLTTKTKINPEQQKQLTDNLLGSEPLASRKVGSLS